LYEFQLGNNASDAARNICAALGEGAVADRTCRDWFKRFREGDLSLEDQPRSGRPLDSNVERLTALIEDNPRLTTRDLSAMLGCNQSTIDYHLHQMGKVYKLGTWVSHQLSPDNMQQRITICNFLLSMRDRYRFLQQIVTGDEK
jgi:transposase